MVEHGEPISLSARDCGFFPRRFARMLAVGEQGGDLSPLLQEMVRQCLEEVNRGAGDRS